MVLGCRLPDCEDFGVRGDAAGGAADDPGDNGAVAITIKKRVRGVGVDKVSPGDELVKLRVVSNACVNDCDSHTCSRGELA